MHSTHTYRDRDKDRETERAAYHTDAYPTHIHTLIKGLERGRVRVRDKFCERHLRRG